MAFQMTEHYATVIAASIAIMPPLFTFAYSIYSNAVDRRNNSKKTYYEQYHKLIQDLAGNAVGFADAQAALVYELRFYRKYRKLSIRILESLRDQWKTHQSTGINTIRTEMEITIYLLKKWPFIWRMFALIKG